jgi:hypothetical protein
MNNEEFKLFNDSNQNCFSNRSRINYVWESMNLSKTSVKIFSQSFKSNQTYQLMVHMIHHDDSSLQSIGYLSVEVENLVSRTINIG